jgi:hypothetical protein
MSLETYWLVVAPALVLVLSGGGWIWLWLTRHRETRARHPELPGNRTAHP